MKNFADQLLFDLFERTDVRLVGSGVYFEDKIIDGWKDLDFIVVFAEKNDGGGYYQFIIDFSNTEIEHFFGIYAEEYSGLKYFMYEDFMALCAAHSFSCELIFFEEAKIVYG